MPHPLSPHLDRPPVGVRAERHPALGRPLGRGSRVALLAALAGVALLAGACNAVVSFDRRLIPQDAGQDAGLDGEVRSDAGTPDAGTPDAGPPDAGTPDAAPPDAGPPPLDGGPDTGPLCDPVTHAGCAGLCCGGRCLLLGMDRCGSCSAGCDATTTDRCEARTCRCGSGPPCAGATPFCRSGACVECQSSAHCAGRPCIEGRCAACDPLDHTGCGGGAPICDAEQGRCVPCRADAECSPAVGGTYCVGGRCGRCEPAGSRGCSGTTPLCDPSSLTCVRCSADAQCGPGTLCLGSGACGACAPSCSGALPVCDRETATCRACASDAECSDDLRCVTSGPGVGRCAACDPGTHGGCGPSAPVCEPSSLRCVQCTPSADRCREIDSGFRCDASFRCLCVDPGRRDMNCQCGAGRDGRCEEDEYCDLASRTCDE